MSTMMGRVVIRQRSPVPFSTSYRNSERSGAELGFAPERDWDWLTGHYALLSTARQEFDVIE
jgi:hypothetical protein